MKMCYFLPADFSASVCWAGCKLSGKRCSEKDEEECESAKQAKENLRRDE